MYFLFFDTLFSFLHGFDWLKWIATLGTLYAFVIRPLLYQSSLFLNPAYVNIGKHFTRLFTPFYIVVDNRSQDIQDAIWKHIPNDQVYDVTLQKTKLNVYDYLPTKANPSVIKFLYKNKVPISIYHLYDNNSNQPTLFPAPPHMSLAVKYKHKQYLIEFIEEAILVDREERREFITVWFIDQDQWWTCCRKSKRSFQSLVYSDKINCLIHDAKWFFETNTAQWYSKQNLPYRRGYLLHGPPGCGKTSFVRALASLLGYDIYVLSITSEMKDSNFLSLIRRIPTDISPIIVLIEDIDCIGISTTTENKDKGKITLSTLLNALDGIGGLESCLIIATTNHIDQLDPRLIRSGRFDCKVQFNHPSPQQIEEMWLRMTTDKPVSVEESVSHADVQAAIQEYVVSCKKSTSSPIE